MDYIKWVWPLIISRNNQLNVILSVENINLHVINNN